jgi:hypothetical protein
VNHRNYKTTVRDHAASLVPLQKVAVAIIRVRSNDRVVRIQRNVHAAHAESVLPPPPLPLIDRQHDHGADWLLERLMQMEIQPMKMQLSVAVAVGE